MSLPVARSDGASSARLRLVGPGPPLQHLAGEAGARHRGRSLLRSLAGAHELKRMRQHARKAFSRLFPRDVSSRRSAPK